MFEVRDTQWKNKTIAFLGDSITEGVGITPENGFWKCLEKELGCVSISFGKSGMVFKELCTQADEMHKVCGDKLDAVVLFAGTNDYNDGVPMGNWYTEPADREVIVGYGDDNTPIYATRKRREFNTDTSTFRGSINAVMKRVKSYYPTKQIIIMTPLHRAYANFGGNNIQYDEMHTDKGGFYLDEYIAVLKEAPNVWACDIIDLHAKSGLFPLDDTQASAFFCSRETDRLHPNVKGHKRIAEAMAAAMTAIPVFSD